jgi:hypothetical protein
MSPGVPPEDIRGRAMSPGVPPGVIRRRPMSPGVPPGDIRGRPMSPGGPPGVFRRRPMYCRAASTPSGFRQSTVRPPTRSRWCPWPSDGPSMSERIAERSHRERPRQTTEEARRGRRSTASSRCPRWDRPGRGSSPSTESVARTSSAVPVGRRNARSSVSDARRDAPVVARQTADAAVGVAPQGRVGRRSVAAGASGAVARLAAYGLFTAIVLRAGVVSGGVSTGIRDSHLRLSQP